MIEPKYTLRNDGTKFFTYDEYGMYAFNRLNHLFTVIDGLINYISEPGKT